MAEREIDPLDFLEIDRLLTDDERTVRDRVRAFVADHILPHVEGWFERGEFPRELSKGFGELGVFGMEMEGYGCPGMSAVETGLAEMEIGKLGQPTERFRLHPGDGFRVEPGVVHRMRALRDATFLEVSTPHLDDVVRLEDRYGRAG